MHMQRDLVKKHKNIKLINVQNITAS